MKKETKKMKTINLIKSATVILLGIAINGQVLAHDEKLSPLAKPVSVQLTHSIKLTGDEIRTIQQLFAQTEAVHVSWNSNELKFSLQGSSVPSDTITFEEINSEPVEGWMLDSDYLNQEVQPLESWMFNAHYLSK